MAASASYPYPSLPLSPSLTISDGEYNPPYSPPKRNPRRATRGASSINAAPGAMPLEQFKEEIAQVSHIIIYKNNFFILFFQAVLYQIDPKVAVLERKINQIQELLMEMQQQVKLREQLKTILSEWRWLQKMLLLIIIV